MFSILVKNTALLISLLGIAILIILALYVVFFSDIIKSNFRDERAEFLSFAKSKFIEINGIDYEVFNSTLSSKLNINSSIESEVLDQKKIFSSVMEYADISSSIVANLNFQFSDKVFYEEGELTKYSSDINYSYLSGNTQIYKAINAITLPNYERANISYWNSEKTFKKLIDQNGNINLTLLSGSSYTEYKGGNYAIKLNFPENFNTAKFNILNDSQQILGNAIVYSVLNSAERIEFLSNGKYFEKDVYILLLKNGDSSYSKFYYDYKNPKLLLYELYYEDNLIFSYRIKESILKSRKEAEAKLNADEIARIETKEAYYVIDSEVKYDFSKELKLPFKLVIPQNCNSDPKYVIDSVKTAESNNFTSLSFSKSFDPNYNSESNLYFNQVGYYYVCGLLGSVFNDNPLNYSLYNASNKKLGTLYINGEKLSGTYYENLVNIGGSRVEKDKTLIFKYNNLWYVIFESHESNTNYLDVSDSLFKTLKL